MLHHIHRCGFPFSSDALRRLALDLLHDETHSREHFLNLLDAELPVDDKLPRLLDGTVNEDKKTGFNLASPKQMLSRFTAVLGEPPVDPDTGKQSTARQALREYAADSPAIAEYLKWKRLSKYRQMTATLQEHLEDDGRIYASYMPMGADTSRFSCRNPNLQQVPRDPRFRNAAVAPEGWVFIAADYSQLELRLIARISGDARMIKAFCNDEDLHTITARTLYNIAEPQPEQRQVGKSANFGLAYGAGARGLRIYAGACGIVMKQETAAEIRHKWLHLYHGVAKWIHAAGVEAEREESTKYIRIPVTLHHRRIVRDKSDRMTVHTNTPVQGAGSSVLKLAVHDFFTRQEFDPQLIQIAGVIHDEIVVLTREEYATKYRDLLVESMEKAERLWLEDVVPAKVTAGIGKTWGTAK